MQPTLCWIDARKMNGAPREELNEIIISSVSPEDIHEAKEALKDHIRVKKVELTQEKVVVDAIKGRQGNSKVQSEVRDILNLMEFLDEKKCMPIFLATSKYLGRLPKKAASPASPEDIINKLDMFENMMKAIKKKVDSNHGEVKREILAMPSYANICKELGATIKQAQQPHSQHQVQQAAPVQQAVPEVREVPQHGIQQQNVPSFTITRPRSRSTKRSRMDDDEVFVEEEYREQRQPRGFRAGVNREERGRYGNNGGRRGSRREFITGGDRGTNFAAPVHIFVANVNKGTDPSAIKDHMKTNKDLEIIDMEKISHENARNDSYRISVKQDDQEKALSADTWPYRVRVRVFRHFRKKR